MKRQTSCLVIAAVLTAFCAVAVSATDYAISIQGVSFLPADLTIQQGDKVTWDNVSGLTHTVTSGTGCTSDGIFDSGLLPNLATYSFTFDTPGTYPYYCIPHCLCCIMVGEITVVAAPQECMLNCPAGDGGPVGGVGPSNKTPDLNGDGLVGLQDVAMFASGFQPNYDACVDYDCDGVAALVDLSIFAMHYLHEGATGVCE